MLSGVYKITNVVNNKKYIGSSLDIKKRLEQHKKSLLEKRHYSIKLQRSYDKYGIENFLFEILEECSKNLLITKEQYYIDLFNSYNDGYNSVPNAGSNLGMIHSEETRNKIRKISTGNKNMLNKKHTEETKSKIREKLKGRSLSDDTKIKMSESIKGKMSNELKVKLINSHKLRKGIKLSEEHKKKLSLSHIDKKQKQSVIEHRSKLNTGKKRTEESKKKISDKLKGIIRGPMSDKHKLKLSKKIYQISEKGDIIKEYNSLKECSIYLNISVNRISEVLRNNRKSYKNYIFKYV